MKNTSIPLDIIFINEEMNVISVHKGVPFSEELITEDNVSFVLEVNENSGIKKEDELEILSNKKIKLDKNSKFLNFNYTNTLEKIYNIEPYNIIYIHNSVHNQENIILGHGIDPSNFEKQIPEPPDNLDEEDFKFLYISYQFYKKA